MSKQETELERVYTVPLAWAWITARHRRTRRAINILREFAEKHMKSSEIKIDTDLNEELWKRGITKPPRRIIVKMEKDEDGIVTIKLPKKSVKTEPERQELPEPTVPAVEEKAKPVEAPKTEKPAPMPAEEKTAKKPRKSAPKKKAVKK